MSLKPNPPVVTSHKTRPRTTFLTLPRELRQCILYQSFDAVVRDIGYLCTLSLEEEQPCPHQEEIEAWRTTLGNVDEGIIDDVRYVGKRWEEAHQTSMAELEELGWDGCQICLYRQ